MIIHDMDKMSEEMKENVIYYMDQAAKHAVSSPETKKRIKNFQAECEKNRGQCFTFNIKPMMEDIKETKKAVEINNNKLTSLELVIAALPEKLMEKLDERYARKDDVSDIKDNIKWVTRIVVGTVIIALLGLVIVNNK